MVSPADLWNRPGDAYPDDVLRTAILSVARVPSTTSDQIELQTVCDRCRAAAAAGEPADDVLEAIAALDDQQREQLEEWVHRGSREIGPAEAVWVRYRRAPPDLRQLIRERLSH